MEFKLSIDELRTRRLFVATPMYGGNCTGMFTRSMTDLTAQCAKMGIHIQCFFLFNESLIQRARNYCVDEFLRSDCTHLLFIDADIAFNPKDVISMLAMQSPNPSDDGYDILTAPYPKKAISWEKIKIAVDKGFADANPSNLERFVGDYVFNPVASGDRISLTEPAEVLEAGTGFMMIRRATLERFADAYPHLKYRPDHARSQHFDGSRQITAFFDTPIDSKRAFMEDELAEFMKRKPNASHDDILSFVRTKEGGTTKQYTDRYLSEDYMFCQYSRRLGMKVWLCPWMKLVHVGTMMFGGTLADLAMIGAPATVDPKALKKKK